MGYSFSYDGSWRSLIDAHSSVGNLVGVNEQHEFVRSGRRKTNGAHTQIEVHHREPIRESNRMLGWGEGWAGSRRRQFPPSPSASRYDYGADGKQSEACWLTRGCWRACLVQKDSLAAGKGITYWRPVLQEAGQSACVHRQFAVSNRSLYGCYHRRRAILLRHQKNPHCWSRGHRWLQQTRIRGRIRRTPLPNLCRRPTRCP
jgi:hypothetical protein